MILCAFEVLKTAAYQRGESVCVCVYSVYQALLCLLTRAMSCRPEDPTTRTTAVLFGSLRVVHFKNLLVAFKDQECSYKKFK